MRDRPRQVVSEIGLIESLLENLLKNALHFTPGPGEITLRLTPLPGSVGVTVADTEVGVPGDHLPKICDRFYRAGNGDEAASSSSGLGLAIVNRISDLHGAHITVTSETTVGTRFDVELPARSSPACWHKKRVR